LSFSARFFLITVPFVLSFQLAAAPVPPQPVPGGFQAGAILRAIADRDLASYFAEASATQATDSRELRDFAVGGYYHLSNNFKIGALALREYGLRHDEDWQLNNGVWSWNDSNSRGENVFGLDVTGKTLLDFLPGEDWVAEFKVRYFYNSFNDNRTLMLRPGLTYFYLRHEELVANFFLQFEYDLPLNYGIQPINEKWIYLGSLYHLSEMMDIGPFMTLTWQTWGPPAAYSLKGGVPYSVTTQTTTLGLTSVLRF
jgi:hypothetical protein